MPVNRIHIIGLICALCTSCIEPFEPALEESQEVLVISGIISDQAGRQSITISRSAPYRKPAFQAVENCVVTVTDQDGNMFQYESEGDGIYAAHVPEDFLELGDAVSLHVITPDMKEYRSTYDTILACPDLDSIYFEIGTQATNDPERNLPGIQFYLDMSGEQRDSRNVIWRVNESWEYHASLFGTHIMWSWSDVEEFRSNVIYKCWKSFSLDQIYTGTTRNLSSNELRRVPLNFVSNETDRLSVTYCLTVQQQSLSQEAYTYWKRMNDQAVESGGFYEKQLASVPGNLYNVADPEEVVLGSFYASQVREKRIFIHNDEFFEFPVPHISCEYESTRTLWGRDNLKFPVYIYSPGPFQPTFTGDSECFDCRLQGGDTLKPSYWEFWP